MKRQWIYQGCAPMGDERGEIRTYTTTVKGTEITREVSRGGAKVRYIVAGQVFKRLKDAEWGVR